MVQAAEPAEGEERQRGQVRRDVEARAAVVHRRAADRLGREPPVPRAHQLPGAVLDQAAVIVQRPVRLCHVQRRSRLLPRDVWPRRCLADVHG